MKIINEFKEFAIKGNMIEMAIGIIIGASFNNVINILVKNILTPPLSLLSEGINFNQKKIILRNKTEGISQVSIEYGLFLETLIDFLIVGFTIFIVVKFFNRLKNKSNDLNDKTVSTPKDIVLLNEIKLILKQQNDIIKNNR
jgi:large conductance mechanosensitive channel